MGTSATSSDGVVEVEPLLQEAETGIGNVKNGIGSGVIEGEPTFRWAVGRCSAGDRDRAASRVHDRGRRIG